jgi:hypothetical protein
MIERLQKKSNEFRGEMLHAEYQWNEMGDKINELIDHLNKQEPLPMVGLRTPDIPSEVSVKKLAKDEICEEALKAGFMITTFVGQEIHKQMPTTDMDTIVRFTQAILSKYDIRRR